MIGMSDDDDDVFAMLCMLLKWKNVFVLNRAIRLNLNCEKLTFLSHGNIFNISFS